MIQSTIDDLCTSLRQELRRDPQGTRVARILAAYSSDLSVGSPNWSVGSPNWRDWVFFEEQTYTRNLVHRCGEFELLLLCWEPGQESPIHDHAGMQCWMAVLDGGMQEVHYKQGAEHGPLVEGRVQTFECGQVSYIVDDIALHLVRPMRGERGVSLHLYSSPIDACRTFDPLTGEACMTDVGYHSVRGELCAEKSAQAVRAEWA